MNVLTEAQRNELKTLPKWFIERLKTAILYKKEMEQELLEEEKRFEEFKKSVVSWRDRLDLEYTKSIDQLKLRLEQAEQEAHGNEKPLQHDAFFEKMLSQRTKTLDLTRETAEKTRASNRKLEDEYAKLLASNEQKESQIQNWEQSTQFIRNRNMSVINGKVNRGPEKKVNCLNTPTNPIPINEIDSKEVPAKVTLESLLELLLDKEYRLVSAILHSLKASEQEKVAGLVVRIFDANGELIPLLRHVISQEVEKTEEIGNLFRSNSISSRMISAYGRLVGGVYLRNTLKPVVDDIVLNNLDLEVDPMKLLGDKVEAQRDSFVYPTGKIEENAKTLIRLASSIVQSIVETRDAAPHEFFEICSLIREIVGAKFSNWKIAIGGFLFLRLYCPVIFLPPDDFGYDLDHTKADAKRTLVLVSKILQNMANFNYNSQDMVMKPFNSFIQETTETIEHYFIAMTIKPTVFKKTSIKDYKLGNLMEGIMNSLISIKPRVIPFLEKYPSNLFVQQWKFTKASKLLAIQNDMTTLGTGSFYDMKNPKVKDFINTIVKDHQITTSILETIVSMKFMSSELEEIASALVTLFDSQNYSATLMDLALKVETEQEVHTVHSFPSSLCGFLFSKICLFRCKTALRTSLGQKVVELARKIDGLMNSSVLVEMGNAFLTGIKLCLNSFPISVWNICSSIAGKPSLGPKFILNLLANQVFCRALEEPEAYTIPSGAGDRVVKKGLFTISELIRSVVKGDRDDSNVEIDEFLKKGHVAIAEEVDKWIKTPPSSTEVNITIEPEEINASMDYIKQFLSRNYTKISLSLQRFGDTEAFVCFNLIEFVEAMSKNRG